MNISSEISFSPQFNSSDDLFLKTYSDVSTVIYIVCILLGFPLNSYVIWLIVTGTGNGLAAEFFILNLCICEILLCLETLLMLLSNELDVTMVVTFLDGTLIINLPLFQCLICVERYLAVVHPVIFLKFKPLRYRLMCSAVAWMVTFGFGALSVMDLLFFKFGFFPILSFVIFVVLLSVKLFCCVAVLRVLKQSGPGERGREREEENHMKKRAFHLIQTSTVIIGIMYSVIFTLAFLPITNNLLLIKVCLYQMCFILAGLVQPVFFLYRVRKLN